MNRKPVDFSNIALIVGEMSEDNAKAASIIDELLEIKDSIEVIAAMIILDDMNIRGVQISTLYKLCNQNIYNLYRKILGMTKEDIEKLNYETFAACKYKAIYDGSKKDREMNPDKYIFKDEERAHMRSVKSKERARDMINEKREIKDLTPNITYKEAKKIIEENGFTCGYKKSYENLKGQTIVYRVFHNDKGDILYAHSLVNPDIFLYGQSKLNVVRKSTITDFEKIGCNAYINIDGVIGYNIELREKPFEKYYKILDRKEGVVEEKKRRYYDSNLFPIIESKESLMYREKRKTYEAIVISEIYNLLIFKETYLDLDDKLKEIYSMLLPFSEERAYDEIIFQLNTNRGVEIIKKLEKVLGIKLNRNELIKAKNRFCKLRAKHLSNREPKFIGGLIGSDVIGKELDKKIAAIISDKITS